MKLHLNMKRIFILIALISTFSTAAIAQSKVGHINSQEILAALPARADAEKKAQDFAAEKQKMIEAMYAEYQASAQKYQNFPADATQTERSSLQTQILDMEGRIQNAETQARQDIAAMEQELITPMLTQVQDAINAVAKANGYSYVFDTSTGVVVFFEGGEDIAPLVKANLGLQ